METPPSEIFLRRLCDVRPREQRDAVVGSHAAQHADAGELVGEELPVVVLQLVDLLLVMGRDAVDRLRRDGNGGSGKTERRERNRRKTH